MTAKSWFIMFVVSVLIVVASIIGINVAVDPFGAFGDSVFNWYSADMTNNPKVAKYSYIDRHKGKFEAFVIGPSGASGISPDVVEKYTGLTCYNMFNYGADMAYTRKLAEYLVTNHSPKHIFLVMPIIAATVYDAEVVSIDYAQPLKPFWRMEFLFANPKYSYNKMKNYKENSYFQQSFSVFNAATGTYDKTKRDAEAIGNLADYLSSYSEFENMPKGEMELQHIDENIAAVDYIKSLCEQAGIGLTVIAPPMYAEEIETYNIEEVTELYEKLAEITEFWCFVNSDISKDPRYFYDTTHYRNSVGDMMLAQIFGDSSIYYPDNFGQLVTTENVASAVKDVFSMEYNNDNEVKLPILMYHHVAEEADNSVTISTENFEKHMVALRDSGYNTISMQELYQFVVMGKDLPENPILITFDDGYASNYEIAYPILQKYNMKAAIFIIGVTFGSETYKETNVKIFPHFGLDEAIEMVESGVIEIGSHTFDMHQVLPHDENPRSGVLQKEEESEDAYVKAFKEDWEKEWELLKAINSSEFIGFAYPFGHYDVSSATLLNEMGVKLTFSSDPGKATVVKGVPASLLQLNRFSINDTVSDNALLELITQ